MIGECWAYAKRDITRKIKVTLIGRKAKGKWYAEGMQRQRQKQRQRQRRVWEQDSVKQDSVPVGCNGQVGYGVGMDEYSLVGMDT